MDKLRDEVALLVNLAVLVEGDVLHLAHSAPREVPRMYTALGRRAVFHCTALGKVLLAHRPWDEVRQLIARFGWRPDTENSFRHFGKLRAALAEARERGFAIDREERRRDVVCVAAPIRDHSGSVVAALSISGQKEKMTPERRQQLVPRLLDAANRISFRMGFHGNAAYL
jgi:DNA-binding IclR family transcriptional regulator